MVVAAKHDSMYVRSGHPRAPNAVPTVEKKGSKRAAGRDAAHFT